MEIQASLLIAQLKAQRNALADEVALAVAQCHHLIAENARLKELSDKQQGLLAEADKLMSAMVKEKDAPVLTFDVKDLVGIGDVSQIIQAGNISPAKDGLKKIRLSIGKKRVRRTKAQMAAFNSEPIKVSDRTPEPYKVKRFVLRSNGTDAAPFCATEDPPTQ